MLEIFNNTFSNVSIILYCFVGQNKSQSSVITGSLNATQKC